MELDYELVQGVVPVGVRPELPLENISMVLGNDLMGSRVWANIPPTPVVVAKPVVSEGPREKWRVFPACTMTCAQSRKESSLDPPGSGGSDGEVLIEHVVPLPDLPSSVSREDWVKSQRADSSLSSLRDEVQPVDKIRDVAQDYFVQGTCSCASGCPVMVILWVRLFFRW